LKKDFVAYKKSIKKSIQSPVSENTDTASQEFCSAISKFFKEKGYSYFQ
jgi:hypothetical protein